MSHRSLVLVAGLLAAGCGSVGELLGVIATDAGMTAGPAAEAGAVADEGAVADAGAVSDADAGVEGSADSPPTVDAMQPAADADATALGQGPFGPVSRVAAVSNANWVNEDPSLSGDQLELYFASSQTGLTTIWVSRRPTMTATWGAPQMIAELGSPANEPCVARDGLTLWFGRPGNSDAAPSSHIWVASRAATTGPWGVPQIVPELAAAGFDDEKPSVDDASLVMVFMSNRPGGAGGLDLYLSTRPTPADPWGTPANLAEVNTAGDERDPFISGQDLQLFWAANPPMQEIRSATRALVTDRFSPSRTLTELGTPDLDPALSVDLHHILFAAQRAGDRHQQIYEAFR